ncbi:hypothetical protein ISS03_03640 [Patescibacteria group bacterium]|nr:hypothetical protein [Patescibacteria group bacterium]
MSEPNSAVSKPTPNLQLPGNPRYQPKQMIPIFGYDNLWQSGPARVEISTLLALGSLGIIPKQTIQLLDGEMMKKLLAITTTEVDRVERTITQHDVRAWIILAKEITGPELGKFVHFPLTSYDALSTGQVLQFKSAHNNALQPAIMSVVKALTNRVRETSKIIQIGRTHGQHAVPITIGFWLATILDRILYDWKALRNAEKNLVGKISGPVGAYNAQVLLGVEDAAQRLFGKSFECLVLEPLNLKPAKISTQILPPGPLYSYLSACTTLSASIAQFGRDCRSLMRTEINEIREEFSESQSGSSTMPHKRNPVHFENMEGMWTKNMGELEKVGHTLISEHQRDLTGSSVSRDFPIIVVNLQHQLNSLLRLNKDNSPFLNNIGIDEERCQRNLKLQGDLIMAEPLYLLLQQFGYEDDAHHLINHTLVPKVNKKKGISLIDALIAESRINTNLQNALEKVPTDMLNKLLDPQQYIGSAVEKAIEIADQADRIIQEIEHNQQQPTKI